jgi:pyridoxal phosphate enzyme (YggS family)
MADVTANLAEIRARVEEATKRSGRDPAEVDLMVVSKTWPVSVIEEAVEAGQVLFGENKVQDAGEKIPQMSPGLRWHFIGHLQRNKVRKILPLVEAVHSIDSVKLARYCDTIAKELGLSRAVYLEVNLGGEEKKHGFTKGVLESALTELRELQNIRIAGLMCIPPIEEDAGKARGWFVALRELRDELERQTGVVLPGLSMGMSHDYEVAIEEGATIVRVGSAIFGKRIKPATD